MHRYAPTHMLYMLVCHVKPAFIPSHHPSLPHTGGRPKAYVQYGFGPPVEAAVTDLGNGKYTLRFVPPNEGECGMLGRQQEVRGSSHLLRCCEVLEELALTMCHTPMTHPQVFPSCM